jgi:ATP-dependent RNA helicase RhlE
MSFQTLGLLPKLLESVSAKGYQRPTTIQRKAIPVILEGKDVMGGAQTGTGKTAAFALPVLQLLQRKVCCTGGPRALVLTPTRELASQVHSSFTAYGSGLSSRSEVVFGGVNINPQIQKLKRGTDVLVACPGRLLDHANRGTVDLSGVEILILDEADRMLDMGFIHDIRRILAFLPKKRQNLLFSATYSDSMYRFAQNLLNQPVKVEVARKSTAAENVKQLVCPVSQSNKRNLLTHLIREKQWGQVLVFTRTKHGANRLCQQLSQDGIGAEALHGNKSQLARTRSLARFKANQISVLVATDIAARGIDIELLPHVVNFDLPNVPEDYIHRIGRTGRAGANGNAVSLVTRQDEPLLSQIEKLLGRRIQRDTALFAKHHQNGSAI